MLQKVEAEGTAGDLGIEINRCGGVRTTQKPRQTWEVPSVSPKIRPRNARHRASFLGFLLLAAHYNDILQLVHSHIVSVRHWQVGSIFSWSFSPARHLRLRKVHKKPLQSQPKSRPKAGSWIWAAKVSLSLRV